MAKSITELTIDLDGIGHTIKDNKLAVPLYQRAYAWEDSNVQDLYDDLLTSIRKGEDEYFIGSIVISAGNEREEVVDGQQRLATISILIAAIRDYFVDSGDTDRAEKLQSEYLSSKDRRTLEVVPFLKLNNADHNYYNNNIVHSPRNYVKASKASHERLNSAFNVAKRKVRSYIDTSSSPAEELLDLCDYIDKKLKVILVKVPSHANAFTIFETLNDRGLELAISDLLKNYLLGQSGNRLTEVQENWTKMFGLLENTENEELVVTFIRHYWSSIYGLTRERDLFNNIKKTINSKQRAVDFSNSLELSGKIYVALIDTSAGFWSDYSGSAQNHMSTLNLFRMTQMRPLLLSIFSKFTKPETEKTLRLLVSISVRFLIVGGLGGGALEVQFSDRAKEISNGAIKNCKDLKTKLEKIIPSDTRFKEAFTTATVSKQYLARYYLMTLENTFNGGENPELIPNADTSSVNLEHIMPKSNPATWGIDVDTHQAYLKRLGNLAILSSKLNSKLGDSSFELKKKCFENSGFSLTQQVSLFKDWGAKSINERQLNLAELALKTWKL